MSNPNQAALEHLRIIRSLMERAHVYRALSAPAAMLGGLLAMAASGYLLWRGKSVAISGDTFLWVWLGILGISAIANMLLLARDAARRGQPVVSDGMRTASRTLAPPLLAGGVLGIGCVLHLDAVSLAATIWVICYGLALLASAGFSPKSLVWLGRIFFLTGLILFGLSFLSPLGWGFFDRAIATIIMGATFGFYHVVYATALFIRGTESTIPAIE